MRRVCVTATVRSALTIHENSREFGAYRDELVESSPVPIVTIDFFNGAMAFSRRHFAEDGAKARGILEARVRELALAAEVEAGNG